MVTTRGQALSVLRHVIAESAANTLTEQAVNTPVAPANRIAMRIWHIVLSDLSPADPANPAADALTQAQTRAILSTRQGLTTLPTMQNAGSLAAWELDVNVRSQAADGGVSEAMQFIGPADWDFSPAGLLVASQELSLYIQSTNAVSVRQAIVTTYYTLETLGAEEFFSLISVIET